MNIPCSHPAHQEPTPPNDLDAAITNYNNGGPMHTSLGTPQDLGNCGPSELHTVEMGWSKQAKELGWSLDQTDVPSDYSFQFYRQLETSQWDGGDHFFDGKHHNFCFACAGTSRSSTLFGCQTCEATCHAGCMTPSLSPDEVPYFYFCPHCMDRELHIPPMNPTTPDIPQIIETRQKHFTSVSSNAEIRGTLAATPTDLGTSPTNRRRDEGNGTRVYLSPVVSGVVNDPERNSVDAAGPRGSDNEPGLWEHGKPERKKATNTEETQKIDTRQAPRIGPKSRPNTSATTTTNTSSAAASTVTTNANKKPRPPSPPPSKAKSASKYTARNSSPARKKSKYSSFSSEVDKALAVIHKHLEVSTATGRAEDDLRDRIKGLEQECRVKDGQIVLSKKELAMARGRGDEEARLKEENEGLKKENERLRDEVRRKDTELNNWKDKLKGLLGDSG